MLWRGTRVWEISILGFPLISRIIVGYILSTRGETFTNQDLRISIFIYNTTLWNCLI